MIKILNGKYRGINKEHIKPNESKEIEGLIITNKRHNIITIVLNEL